MKESEMQACELTTKNVIAGINALLRVSKSFYGVALLGSGTITECKRHALIRPFGAASSGDREPIPHILSMNADLVLMAPTPVDSAGELLPHWPESKRETRLREPIESFFKRFLQLNQFELDTCFLFQPGMLFNDTLQWWRSRNRQQLSLDFCRIRHEKKAVLRPRPHEGIDICLLQRRHLLPERIRPQMLIPSLLSGQLVHFHSDFLGQTLYIRHDQRQREGAVLHTLYGHVAAITGPNTTGELPGAGKSCSSFLDRGQVVGTISSPPATCSVPAHLHISCAWIREEQPVDELNWDNMVANANVFFIDPLPFLIR